MKNKGLNEYNWRWQVCGIQKTVGPLDFGGFEPRNMRPSARDCVRPQRTSNYMKASCDERVNGRFTWEIMGGMCEPFGFLIQCLPHCRDGTLIAQEWEVRESEWETKGYKIFGVKHVVSKNQNLVAVNQQGLTQVNPHCIQIGDGMISGLEG